MIVQNTKYMRKLIEILASRFSEDQRKEIYNYFESLTGNEFAKDSVKNYSPKGKAISTKEPIKSGQITGESKSEPEVKTASKKDRDVIERYWEPLYGNSYAKKMVSLETKAKQTKTAKVVDKKSKKNVLNQDWIQ